MPLTEKTERLKALLGIRYPIIQAPMAGISTPALAAAITNAGGLGSIALGACSLDKAKTEWRETRALTEGSLNLNTFAHQPPKRDARMERRWIDHLAPLFHELGAAPPDSLSSPYRSIGEDPERFELLLSLRPRAASFHFGLPLPEQIDELHRRGVITMASATSLEEGEAIEAAGVQICIAQGIEAGGHRGVFDPERDDHPLRLDALLAELRRALSIPIVAAGGIMNGERIRELLQNGAAGVQLGTAFLLTREAATPDAYRARLKSADAKKTRLIRSLSGRPARGIPNRITARAEIETAPTIPPYPVAYDATKRLQALAYERGAPGFLAEWAGEGAPLLRELPAHVLFERLIVEAGLQTP